MEENKKNKSIFSINAEFTQLMIQLEEQEGVFEEDQISQLEILEEELEQKLRNYKHMIAYAGMEEEMLKDEIKRYRSRIKTKENLVDRLKANCITAIQLWGDANPKTGTKAKKFFDFSCSVRDIEYVYFDESAWNNYLDNITAILDHIDERLAVALSKFIKIKFTATCNIDQWIHIENLFEKLHISNKIDFEANTENMYEWEFSVNNKNAKDFIKNAHSNDVESKIVEESGMEIRTKPSITFR